MATRKKVVEEHELLPSHHPIPARRETSLKFWEGWSNIINPHTFVGKLALIPYSDIDETQARIRLLHNSAKRLNQNLKQAIFRKQGPIPEADLWLHISDVVNTFETALRALIPAELFAEWDFSWLHLTLAMDLATLCTWRYTRKTHPIRCLTNAAEVQELEIHCRKWGGARKVWRMFEYLSDLERIEKEFWFLMVPCGDRKVFIGHEEKVYDRDITTKMLVAVVGPMREWCEKKGFGKACWENEPREVDVKVPKSSSASG
ncbi:hypothetical protein BJ508DRAFT_312853 [Ascobolus immersus RN42]|uniref:Uncharacterized protein n=1 Tax=Ascobolus immersus RN42 TaxID=1160509 RepID=A0A3N4HNG7_ASCIM|nr:hypothetical protein BJ508DRAFT_312853 [Ascobolus immersus RN42]